MAGEPGSDTAMPPGPARPEARRECFKSPQAVRNSLHCFLTSYFEPLKTMVSFHTLTSPSLAGELAVTGYLLHVMPLRSTFLTILKESCTVEG